MSSFADEFSDVAQFVDEEEEMPLDQIQDELDYIIDLANRGEEFDEKRMDFLIRARKNNSEYKLILAKEQEEWRESIREFTIQCLERTRTFVPLEIFDSSNDDLIGLGLSPEIARRILQKQCLWLVRMSPNEISRLHESDLIGRFNSMQQNMDIIETAAIFASLPETFQNDRMNTKHEWKDAIEENLRQMLLDNDEDVLPPGKIRNPAYGGLQFGPIRDVTSTRVVEVVSHEGMDKPRRSFIELCKAHSIINRMKEKV